MTSTASAPLIAVEQLRKEFRRSRLSRVVSFRLEADFAIERPAIVGLLGPNGSGKTTLFDLIAGSAQPSSGRVLCNGENIHKVRYEQRGQLVNQRRQPYHTRQERKPVPNFLLRPTQSRQARIHLFDEPDMNDWYFPLFVDYIRKNRQAGNVVFLCVHPTKPEHLQILRRICERYVFVHAGTTRPIEDFDALMADADAQEYLGPLLDT
jgi:ABC-type cobalamin/Fe3+-siderophores transport system ATPase subunit